MLILFKLLWNYAQKAVKKYLPWYIIYYNIRILYAHSYGMVVLHKLLYKIIRLLMKCILCLWDLQLTFFDTVPSQKMENVERYFIKLTSIFYINFTLKLLHHCIFWLVTLDVYMFTLGYFLAIFHNYSP